jgi:predicted component of type VI protein secretion system
MFTRPNRKTKSLATQAAELAFAVPQVVTHRITRMAMAGQVPSARDRKEFDLMVAEKNAAFAQSWLAMANQSVMANQALSATWLRAMCSPIGIGAPSVATVLNQVHGATLGVLGKGLAPVHRKAVANAKRLARTRLR